MQISIHLFATYRNLIGVSQFNLEVTDDCDVQAAIDQVLQRYPILRQHWCNQDGELMPHLFIILNKQDVGSMLDGLKTKLKAGDELDFVPPVGGG